MLRLRGSGPALAVSLILLSLFAPLEAQQAPASQPDTTLEALHSTLPLLKKEQTTLEELRQRLENT